MGIYASVILPRLLDLAMRNIALSGYRQATISAARVACSKSASAPV